MHFYCYVYSSLFKSCICRRRIPQLLTCLVRREGQKILNLLCNIGRVHPQVTASAIAEKLVVFVSILFNYIVAFVSSDPVGITESDGFKQSLLRRQEQRICFC